MERITRLSKGAWLELLEEVQNRMKSSETPDHEMVNEFTAEYPDYSYYLINSAVKTSRQFLNLSHKVRQIITDDIYIFGLATKDVIKKVSEITGKDYSLIAAIVFKLGPQINQAILIQAEILAKNCIYSLTDSPWKIAKAIMHEKLNLGWEFVAGMTLANAIENRQIELKKEERDKLEKKRLELEKKRLEIEEAKKRQEEERREKRRQEELKKDLIRSGKVKEILNRPRVPIRYANSATSSIVPLSNEGEAALMKNGTKVILNGEIYEIEKSSSGQVRKKIVVGAKVIESKKSASVTTETLSLAAKETNIEKATPRLTLTKNAIWVVFQNKLMKLIVAPEDIKGNASSLEVEPGTLIVTEKTLKVFEIDKKGLAYAGNAKKPAKKPSEEERRFALYTSKS